MGGLSEINTSQSALLNAGNAISQVVGIEWESTNLLLRSADFSNAAWTKNSVTVAANSAYAPNGALQADTLTDNSAVVTGDANQAVVIVADTVGKIFSCFFTAGTSQDTRITLALTGGVPVSGSINFNPLTGIISLETPGVRSNVTTLEVNGTTWFRVSLSLAQANNTLATVTIQPSAATVAGVQSVIVWGAQLEQLPADNVASSYIPTTTAAVTRAAGVIPSWLAGVGGALPAVGGAGAILRSDGTQWAVSQTTYPDIVAANNVLFASASNTVSSDATLKYSASAGVGLQVANLIDISGANGGQIKFPATANPSANANTLDDYEEGTWTASDGSGAGLGVTSALTTYTKIGNRVYIGGYVVYPANANGNLAVISGLPFTSGTDNDSVGSMTSAPASILMIAYMTTNTANLSPRRADTSATVANSVLTSAVLSLGFQYKV